MQAMALEDPGYVAPPAELAEFLERRFLGGSPAMLQGMGDALRLEPDRVAELAATGLPVLVVHGEDDDAWPPQLQPDDGAAAGRPLRGHRRRRALARGGEPGGDRRGVARLLALTQPRFSWTRLPTPAAA